MKTVPLNFIDLTEKFHTASSPTAYLKKHSTKSPLLKKNINKVFQGKVDEDNLKQSSSVVNSQVADSLGQLLDDLNMVEENEYVKEYTTDDEETEDPTLQTEIEMTKLGLPVSFGKQKTKIEKKRKR